MLPTLRSLSSCTGSKVLLRRNQKLLLPQCLWVAPTERPTHSITTKKMGAHVHGHVHVQARHIHEQAQSQAKPVPHLQPLQPLSVHTISAPNVTASDLPVWMRDEIRKKGKVMNQINKEKELKRLYEQMLSTKIPTGIATPKWAKKTWKIAMLLYLAKYHPKNKKAWKEIYDPQTSNAKLRLHMERNPASTLTRAQCRSMRSRFEEQQVETWHTMAQKALQELGHSVDPKAKVGTLWAPLENAVLDDLSTDLPATTQSDRVNTIGKHQLDDSSGSSRSADSNNVLHDSENFPTEAEMMTTATPPPPPPADSLIEKKYVDLEFLSSAKNAQERVKQYTGKMQAILVKEYQVVLPPKQEWTEIPWKLAMILHLLERGRDFMPITMDNGVPENIVQTIIHNDEYRAQVGIWKRSRSGNPKQVRRKEVRIRLQRERQIFFKNLLEQFLTERGESIRAHTLILQWRIQESVLGVPRSMRLSEGFVPGTKSS